MVDVKEDCVGCRMDRAYHTFDVPSHALSSLQPKSAKLTNPKPAIAYQQIERTAQLAIALNP